MAIVWDQVGERRYETGIDRGVLYPQDGSPPVPWNGLVSVAESQQGQSVSPLYIDGVKYSQYHRAGEYRASLSAFTYPDVLDRLTGLAERVGGIHLHDQQSLPFHLSYRTLVGDDIQGLSSYKVHVIYNVLAVPRDHTYQTVGASSDVPTFEWDLSSTPLQIPGVRPVSHISFDSRRTVPSTLAAIEGSLYIGTDPDPLGPMGGSVDFLSDVVSS